MKIIVLCQALMILLFTACKNGTSDQKEALTVVIGAFNEEILYLEEHLEGGEEIYVEGLRFVRGDLNNREVVLGISGIGKVNAAMTTALVIHHFHPEQLIFTGIAGGLNPDLHPGDLVIAEQTVQHDLVLIGKDTTVAYLSFNPVNDSINPVYFISDTSLIRKAKNAAENTTFIAIETDSADYMPKVISGIIATGDAFIASKQKKEMLINTFNADAVEMEGAAVAQVCYQLGVPCIIIRSISDNADDKAEETIEEFYKIAAENSANLVMALLLEQ